jgi:hypothetical protein
MVFVCGREFAFEDAIGIHGVAVVEALPYV